MVSSDQIILGYFFNIVILLFMLISGIWVGIDAHKTGCSRVESITWGFFAGLFIIVGPICYVLFKNHIYKSNQ